MDRFFVFALRAAVVAAALAGLFAQAVVIPGMAADEAALFPPYEPLVVPYVTVAIIGVACVQVALAATWVLLGMLRRDALFSSRAFRWVDVIIGSAVVATLLAAGVTVHIAVADIPGDNMQVVSALGAAFLTTGAGAAFVMLVVLMRGLLRKATDLKTEMSEVV